MGDLVDGAERDAANDLTVAELLDTLRGVGFRNMRVALALPRHAVLVADRAAAR